MCCFNIGVKVRKPIIVTKHDINGNVKAIYYDYSVCVEDGKKYLITYFWPVGFKFNKNSIDDCIFILNKVV